MKRFDWMMAYLAGGILCCDYRRILAVWGIKRVLLTVILARISTFFGLASPQVAGFNWRPNIS